MPSTVNNTQALSITEEDPRPWMAASATTPERILMKANTAIGIGVAFGGLCWAPSWRAATRRRSSTSLRS